MIEREALKQNRFGETDFRVMETDSINSNLHTEKNGLDGSLHDRPLSRGIAWTWPAEGATSGCLDRD
jgi:hypothetical protein